MSYDFKHAASVCTNELFYRNGSEAKDIKRNEAYIVSEVIERYMREAADVETGQRILTDAKIKQLKTGIIDTAQKIKLMRDASKDDLEKAKTLQSALDVLAPLRKLAEM